MLFSTYSFIFAFLPVTVIVYYYLLKKPDRGILYARLWLVLMSFVFYSWFNLYYLTIILCSITVNFMVGKLLIVREINAKSRKLIFVAGVLFNVLLLGYFKYYDFFISNINVIFNTSWELRHILLPLGISFFTFQQLSYLIDAYKGSVENYSLLDFSLFVTFFP